MNLKGTTKENRLQLSLIFKLRRSSFFKDFVAYCFALSKRFLLLFGQCDNIHAFFTTTMIHLRGTAFTLNEK